MTEETETWITIKGRTNGRAWAQRYPLGVSIELARGHLERMSDVELRWALNDLKAEMQRRRRGQPALLAAWPEAGMYTGSADAA